MVSRLMMRAVLMRAVLRKKKKKKVCPVVQQVGYSVSPMGGQDSLESSLLGRSNPSHRIHISMPTHTLASDAAGAHKFCFWRVHI